MVKSVGNKADNQGVEIDEKSGLISTTSRSALSGWPMIVAWLGMIIFAFHASTHMVGAGDTWVALACGRHFYNHGVDTVEPFSANSRENGPTEEEIENWPGWARWITEKVGIDTVRYWHPTGWVNQNWLTHYLYNWLSYKSPIADGPERVFNTLVYWKIALYILAVICVYYIGRFMGVNPALSAVFACLAMFIGRSFFDIRPAGFSNFLVGVFFLLLVLTGYRNILYIWLMVPLLILWCNLHGGYIYAFIMLVPFFLLHLFIYIHRRWSVCLYSILTWVGLYALTYVFLRRISIEMPFVASPELSSDRVFYLVFLLIILSILATYHKRIRNEVLYTYHALALLIVFFSLLPRYFPAGLVNQPKEIVNEVKEFRFSFIMALAALIGVGIVVNFLKDRLKSIGRRGLYHTFAAGFATFIAVLVFNPFHLTNLTHTFVISVSKQAERWRTVNEWHPAFEFGNPVGTSFPFLVMLIMSIGLTVFWLYSRSFRPRNFRPTKKEFEYKRIEFDKLLKIFGFAFSIFMFWVAFLSLSSMGLDAGGFFFCALFGVVILLSIFVNVHFIYFQIPLVFLAVAAAGPVRYHVGGRYMYPFWLVPMYLVFYIIASRVSKVIKYKPENILYVTLTAVVSLLLITAKFDPFNFKESLWHLEQFWNIKRPWIPNYEGEYEVNYANLFPVLHCLNLASILMWLAWPLLNWFIRLRPTLRNRYSSKKWFIFVWPAWTLFVLLIWLIHILRKFFIWIKEKDEVQHEQKQTYEFPKVEFSLLIIAALTIYMAIRSRRFITIAAVVACPVLAMFIQQIVRTVCAARNYYYGYSSKKVSKRGNNRSRGFVVSPMPNSLKVFFIGIGIAAVAGFGTWWGLKFKRIYLDPWPTDERFNSVFMRMTASDAKPFYAGDFIRLNRLEGIVFNYWTEGGFIAWVQEPDPNTGHTLLKVFMDGRAQAAYPQTIYDLWANIMAGGSIGYNLQKKADVWGRPLNAQELRQIGKWIDKSLKNYKELLAKNNEQNSETVDIKTKEDKEVWAVLMPAGEFDTVFVRALTYNPNWQLIFFNNKQKLFVDVRTPQAKKLFEGIWSGKTVYPTKFSEYIIKAHRLLVSARSSEEHRRGFEFAKKAFNERPSQTPLRKIMRAVNYPKLSNEALDFCREYFESFQKNKDALARQDGYHRKLVSAFLTAQYLSRIEKRRGNKEKASEYLAKYRMYKKERAQVIESKRW